MKSKATLISLASFLSLSLINPVSILAEEASQNQELEQRCKTVCETGAYGQDTSCTTECYQYGEQEQIITLRDGTVLAAHTPVDTALDVKTTLFVSAILVSGLTAFLVRKKLV